MPSRGLRLLLFAATSAAVIAVQRPRIKDGLHQPDGVRTRVRHKAPPKRRRPVLNTNSSLVQHMHDTVNTISSIAPRTAPLAALGLAEQHASLDHLSGKVRPNLAEFPAAGQVFPFSASQQFVGTTMMPLMRTMPNRLMRTMQNPGSWRSSGRSPEAGFKHELVIPSAGLLDPDASLAELEQVPTTGAPVATTAAVAAAAAAPAAATPATVAPGAATVAPVAGAVVVTTAAPSEGGGFLWNLLIIVVVVAAVATGVTMFLRWRASQKKVQGRLAGVDSSTPDGSESQFWKSAKSRQSYRKSAMHNTQASDSEDSGKNKSASDSTDRPSNRKEREEQKAEGTASKSAGSYRDRRGRGGSAAAADPDTPKSATGDESGEKEAATGGAPDGTASAKPSGSRSRRGQAQGSAAGTESAPVAASSERPARSGSSRARGGRSGAGSAAAPPPAADSGTAV